MASETPEQDAPTESLVAGTVGDKCVNCGHVLASDQRYCVVCGERRGAPRFTLPATARGAKPGGADPPPRNRAPRNPRVSSPTTLVAGVGTLLLAMGVGVLIGRGVGSNDSKTVASAAPQVITVNGGGGSGTSGNTSSSTSGSGSTRKSSKSSGNKKPKKKVVVVDKKQASAENSAASKVLGSKGNTPPPTVTVGQKGHGAGYNKKSGKFDGSFFGQ